MTISKFKTITHFVAFSVVSALSTQAAFSQDGTAFAAFTCTPNDMEPFKVGPEQSSDGCSYFIGNAISDAMMCATVSVVEGFYMINGVDYPETIMIQPDGKMLMITKQSNSASVDTLRALAGQCEETH